MAKIQSYPAILNSQISPSDLVVVADQSGSYATKNMTFEEIDKRYATTSEVTASSIGIKYFWVDIADRNAETGMTTGEQGIMTDTAQNRTDEEVGKVYRYSGSAWVYQYTLQIVGAVYDSDFDLNNNYLIRSQTTLDSWPFPSLRYNGSSSRVQFTSNQNLEFGTTDGTILFFTNTIVSDSKYLLWKFDGIARSGYTILVSSGKIRVNIGDGTNEIAESGLIDINDGSNHAVEVTIDRVNGQLKIYIDGKIDKTIDMSSVTGSLNNSLALSIGSTSTPSLFFDGIINTIYFFNYVRTESQIKTDINPLKDLDWIDEGGSQIGQTSGTLMIGKKYRINTYVSGDDFTNIGGTNVTGNEFVATGTTPTTWTNSSSLVRLGCIFKADPRNITIDSDNELETQYDSSGNNNNGSGTDVEVVNALRQEVEEEGTFTATLTPGTSGSITLASAYDTLSYRKIGNKVEILGRIDVGSVSSPTGTLALGGLPYACADGPDLSKQALINVVFTDLQTATTGSIRATIAEGGQVVYIQDEANGTGAASNTFANHIKAGTTCMISGFYFTDG